MTVLDNDTPRPASEAPLRVTQVFDPNGPLPIDPVTGGEVQQLLEEAQLAAQAGSEEAREVKGAATKKKTKAKRNEEEVRNLLGKLTFLSSNTNVTVGALDGGVIANVGQEVPSLEGGLCAITGNRQRLRYTPPDGFVGVDLCFYEACDERDGCGTAFVFLDVVGTVNPTEFPTEEP